MRGYRVVKTLVTGGIRSGKSAVAEALCPTDTAVTYVATGPVLDDPDWARRVQLHRRRRPQAWHTVETTELADALAALDGPALIDSVGTWVQATLDRLGAWESPQSAWVDDAELSLSAVEQAWRQCPHDLVAVTNEVGLGLVSEHRSGRLFADWLGVVNQRLASASDRVLLVVAGQTVEVKCP